MSIKRKEYSHDDSHYDMDSTRNSTESNEEKIFALLFRECDSSGTGLVDVKEIVDYIRHMQLQVQKTNGEEVLEPQDSSGMDYDLRILQSMLECNCDRNNRINEAAYSHIIRKWVNDVRDRSTPSSPLVDSSLEVTDFTETSPSLEYRYRNPSYRNTSYGNTSYGSSGGDGSTNSIDAARPSYNYKEWGDMVSKYQHEIKQLTERNRALIRQYDSSEESLRECQSRNLKLQHKLEEAQESLSKLKAVEESNIELTRTLSDLKKHNEEISWAREKQSGELERISSELLDAQIHYANVESDRAKALEEVKSIQHLLMQSKEIERDLRAEFNSKLTESRSQLDFTNRELEDANNRNADLKLAISEMETQLHQLKSWERDRPPVSSTPCSHAKSLQEELLDQDCFTSKPSIDVSPLKYPEIDLEGVPHVEISRTSHRESQVTPATESFSKFIDDTDSKIKLRHTLILRDLNELLQQSPTSSYRENTSINSREGNSLDRHSFDMVENKLKGLLRKKNQFKNENMNLKKENSDLKEQLKAMMAQKQPTIITDLTDDRSNAQENNFTGGSYGRSPSYIPVTIDGRSGEPTGPQGSPEGRVYVQYTSEQSDRKSLPLTASQSHSLKNANTLHSTGFDSSVTDPYLGTDEYILHSHHSSSLANPSLVSNEKPTVKKRHVLPHSVDKADMSMVDEVLTAITEPSASTSLLISDSAAKLLFKSGGIAKLTDFSSRNSRSPSHQDRGVSPQGGSILRRDRSHSRSHSLVGGRLSRSHSPVEGRLSRSHSLVGGRLSRSHSPMEGRLSRSHSSVAGHLSHSHSPMRGRLSRSHSPVGGHLSHSHSPVRGRLSRSHSPVGGRLSRSHSPVGGRLSRSHSPVGGRLSRSHSPVGGRLSRSHSPVVGRLSRSHSPVVGRLSRSHSPVGGRLSRSRSPVGSHLSRSRSPVGSRLSRSPVGSPLSHSPVGSRLSHSLMGGRLSSVGSHRSRSHSPVDSYHSHSSVGNIVTRGLSRSPVVGEHIESAHSHTSECRHPSHMDDQLIVVPEHSFASDCKHPSHRRAKPESRLVKFFNIVRHTVVLLLFVILLLTLLVLIVLSQDAFSQGGYICPHSPINIFYSTLQPYLHYMKYNTPM